MRSLVERAKAGDRSAQEEVLSRLRGLVYKLAIQYHVSNYLEVEDLVVVGNLGVLWAIETYDPSHPKAAEFASYAFWWIRRYIQRELDKNGHLVRVPKLSSSKGIGDPLDITSIEGRIEESDGEWVGVEDIVARRWDCEDGYEDAARRVENALAHAPGIAAALSALADEEREVLIARYGLDGKPTRKIGKSAVYQSAVDKFRRMTFLNEEGVIEQYRDPEVT